MRELTFKMGSLRTAVAFVTALYEMHNDVIERICLHRSDECGRWPLEVVLYGPRTERVYDELLRTLTTGLPLPGNDDRDRHPDEDEHDDDAGPGCAGRS